MFGNQLDLILDGGPATSAEPSTVVDVTGNRAVLVRPGRVDVSPYISPGR